MSKSLIEWCDHSVNVIDGCSPVSKGCDLCYAARMCGTRCSGIRARVALLDQSGHVRDGVRCELVTRGKRADDPTKARYVYNGRVALNTDRLAKVLKIPKNGGKTGSRVFWNFQSDTFHERLSFEDIAAQFAVMATRPDLQFMVLTKRPERAREWFREWSPNGLFSAKRYWDVLRDRIGVSVSTHQKLYERLVVSLDQFPLTNVAIGVSAEDQQRWDERVPILLELPAAYRFVSAEPLLGAIDPSIPIANTSDRCVCSGEVARLSLDGDLRCTECGASEPALAPCINQVIIGAESGPGARPCELEWIQDLGRQVLDAQTWQPIAGKERMGWVPALFVKQADVCPECGGLGTNCEDCIAEFGDTITARDACDMKCLCGGQGTRGKLRKHCPEVWIPGHGARQWNQHFWEPRQP